METNKPDVPYIVHEGEIARLERMVKRFWILVLVLIALLVCTNGAWLLYESKFEDVTLTQEAATDGGGDVVVNGVASGNIYYGESETNDQDPTP